MICDFPFSKVFQSYQDDGKVIMKGCVHWKPKDFRLKLYYWKTLLQTMDNENRQESLYNMLQVTFSPTRYGFGYVNLKF